MNLHAAAITSIMNEIAHHSIQKVPLDIFSPYDQVNVQKMIHQAVIDITKLLSLQ